MPAIWRQGKALPRCLAHPGSTGTVDVRSLRGTFVAALMPSDLLRAWHDLTGGGFELPEFEPGDLVPLEELALIVGFIDAHLQEAAAEAARIAGTDAGLALSGFQPPASVATELVRFVRAVRRWLADAQLRGGPAAVREEPATIFDPTVVDELHTRTS